jgi:hypothetical protein
MLYIACVYTHAPPLGMRVLCLLLAAAVCAVTAAPSLQDKVQHIIVVMLENRSFDHVLGFLKADNPDIEGLTGTESNAFNVSDPASPRVTVSHDAPYVDPGSPIPCTRVCVCARARAVRVCVRVLHVRSSPQTQTIDAGHGLDDTRQQIFGVTEEPPYPFPPAPMNGFVMNAEHIQSGWGPQVRARTLTPSLTPSHFHPLTPSRLHTSTPSLPPAFTPSHPSHTQRLPTLAR